MSGLMGLLNAEARMGSIGSDFLVSAGASFTSRRADHAYPGGMRGACFENAFQLARRNPELTYCEGRALSLGIVPIEHAWCIDVDGKVIDTTWDDCETEYVGVQFATPFLIEWVARRRLFGVLANEFPVELINSAPSTFLARPSPAQLAGATRVLERARSILQGTRPAAGIAPG
jgi:hypothetical protein